MNKEARKGFTGMKEKITSIFDSIGLSLLDEKKRIRLQYIWVYSILTAVSLFMTVVNIITAKFLLMFATLIFGIMCCVNMVMAKKSERMLYVAGWIFSIELIALLTFFVVSGTPEGFSAIWACFLPASGLLLFRRKRGTVLCIVMLIILLFFLETNLGNGFLQYEYTDSFKLRFPMLYVAFFAVSFLLESIRSFTFNEMRKAREKYEYLYRHDALTEVYNRYGFNERMDCLLDDNKSGAVSMLILDIDYFKNVNDVYGHSFGDMVLKEIAGLLLSVAGTKADVCRWGGEEFAVLFSDDDDAIECGKAILETLRSRPINIGGQSVFITASIGIAVAASNKDLSAALFVKTADDCLYEAKEGGRNAMVYKKVILPKRLFQGRSS